jgi:hypothetical protein
LHSFALAEFHFFLPLALQALLAMAVRRKLNERQALSALTTVTVVPF